MRDHSCMSHECVCLHWSVEIHKWIYAYSQLWFAGNVRRRRAADIDYFASIENWIIAFLMRAMHGVHVQHFEFYR